MNNNLSASFIISSKLVCLLPVLVDLYIVRWESSYCYWSPMNLIRACNNNGCIIGLYHIETFQNSAGTGGTVLLIKEAGI